MMSLLTACLFLLQACQLLNAQISPYLYAHCDFGNDPNVPVERDLEGFIDFRQLGYGPLEVKINLHNFNTEDEYKVHGVHIHDNGDLTAATTNFTCANSGPHFNPLQAHHGAPDNSLINKHLGDLGNFAEDDEGFLRGRAHYEGIGLHGRFSIIGKIFAIAKNADDMGKGGDEASLIDGNSDVDIGCCVVGRADDRGWYFD